MTEAETEKLRQIVADLQAGFGEPNWKPLENFCAYALYEPSAVSGFMWMGAALGPKGDCIVHSFKHGLTRRYLHLDDKLGLTYEYVGDAGGPEAFGNPIYREVPINVAIARLDLDMLPEMGATMTTPYDAAYRARRDAALAEAGYVVINPQPGEDS